MATAAAAVRKTVTVLFCDLAGSTELGERVDPERLRELLAIWFDAMAEPIARHGGTVEKFIGDAVMAVFGVPTVHEDDAVRAVLAALEMREAVDRLNVELALALQVRIGINTGEVATGDGVATLVSGDAVNTAKRLEESAAPGEIVVGAPTRQLVGNAVELEQLAPVDAKGKRHPVEAWRVRRTIPGAASVARRLDTPLVGRIAELELLRSELELATRERSCRLVTVLGPAGIGKSRLAAELHATLVARCLPYGDGFSLQPLQDVVRAAGGEQAVLDAVAGEPDGALVATRMCSGGGGTTEEYQWAVRRLLEILARRQPPLVVCIEDLHWAQPAFLDLVEYLVGWSRDAPILLVCVARPELLDMRPRWPGATVTLRPLTVRETDELLDELESEWPLDPATRTQVAETAEGNPLFLEQLVAMLADGGTTDDLPPTIQAVLAARLDALEPPEQRVLERAAVIGRDFPRAAVTALADGDVSAPLLSLVRKELLRPLPSPYAADDGFRFRHALIRDAAYAAIPKRLRAELHERTADWLTEHDDDEEVVGFHLEQAHLLRRDLGMHDAASGERAGDLLGAAGIRAAARGDAAAARGLLTRSLELLPDAHAMRPRLLNELSAALWLAAEPELADAALTESIDAAVAAGDERLEWYGRLDRAARGGDVELLERTAEQAVVVFEALHDELGLARAWRRVALLAHRSRRWADGAAAAERAVRHAEASGDEQERARSADLLATTLLYGPARVDEAIVRLEVLYARAVGNPMLHANVGTSLAALLAMRGDTARARELCATAGATFEELGLRMPWIGWCGIAAIVEELAGDADAAAEHLQRAHAAVAAGGHDTHAAYYASSLALLLARNGRAERARVYADLAARSRSTLDDDALARLQGAEALLGGDETAARAAVATARRTDDLNLQAETLLVLARVADDPAAAAEAVRLFELKGNVAFATTAGLLSPHP